MGHVNSYGSEVEDKVYEGSSERDGESDGDHPTHPQVQLLWCIQNKPLLILSSLPLLSVDSLETSL